jgi:hypothetical protein
MIWEAGKVMKIERTEDDRILRLVSVSGFTHKIIVYPEESEK